VITMAWAPCKKCKALRKVDVVVSTDGWHQPACYECGDPEYLEPLEKPAFDMAVPAQATFSLSERDFGITHVAGLVFVPVSLSDQEYPLEEE
jgi:hypothetical protein